MSQYAQIGVDYSIYAQTGEIIQRVPSVTLTETTDDLQNNRDIRVGTTAIYIESDPTIYGSIGYIDHMLLINRSEKYTVYATWQPAGGSLGTMSIPPSCISKVTHVDTALTYVCILEAAGNYADVKMLLIGAGAA